MRVAPPFLIVRCLHAERLDELQQGVAKRYARLHRLAQLAGRNAVTLSRRLYVVAWGERWLPSTIVVTVLVVEDDWLIREDIVTELRQEGWAILEAATGAGALKALRDTEKVDLLIADIRLADALTGWDVAEAFRIAHPKVPVIYASGNSANDHRRVAGSVFLNKPVAVSELTATCRKLFVAAGFLLTFRHPNNTFSRCIHCSLDLRRDAERSGREHYKYRFGTDLDRLHARQPRSPAGTWRLA